ncbi:MAG: hypothetical protein RLY20_1026 [Verrucomicrobiota bacterium]|jgi:RNA polymerase sigma factor (sigma-70 family)
MHEPDDQALLRQYAEQNSEAAFATLVARHVDKVYSAALRRTRNAHAAEEITQAVFVILAKKSGRLGAKVILAGWLYETARLTAVTYIRSEIRRTRREQEAFMQTTLNENAEDAWPHIAPLLDDALAGLSAADRHAVVLRYFDGKSLGEVGAALGASEDAAKKRVTRAVEKLRGWLTKRGVTLTATVLTAAISANSVQASPLGLAATVTATAKGTLISATITTLVNTTMKTMTWLKIKFAVGVGVAALLAGGAATLAVSQTVGKNSTTTVAPTTQQQVVIKGTFVRVPNSRVEKLLSAINSSGTLYPESKLFRDAVKNCPGAVLLSSPGSVVTLSGRQAIVSTSEDVSVGDKQIPVGTTLDVTPEVQPDEWVMLKLATESSELVPGATPSIRMTKATETTKQQFKNGETLILLRCPVGSPGKNLKPAAGSPEETLLVFVNATLIDKFGNRIQR